MRGETPTSLVGMIEWSFSKKLRFHYDTIFEIVVLNGNQGFTLETRAYKFQKYYENRNLYKKWSLAYLGFYIKNSDEESFTFEEIFVLQKNYTKDFMKTRKEYNYFLILEVFFLWILDAVENYNLFRLYFRYLIKTWSNQDPLLLSTWNVPSFTKTI